jgi:hypothetical protein
LPLFELLLFRFVSRRRLTRSTQKARIGETSRAGRNGGWRVPAWHMTIFAAGLGRELSQLSDELLIMVAWYCI